MPTPPAGRSAVVAPGGTYGPDGPLLMFARLAAQRRGAEIRALAWDFPTRSAPSQGPVPDLSTEREQVAARAAAAAGELAGAGGGTPLLIGKSLGSLAAPVAADRGLPAIWFTPILTDPELQTALGQARAPFLLIGGTADHLWDGAVARSLTPHVVEAAGADHGMFRPGPLAASAEILGQVVTAVEAFLDQVVWPG